jgi:hypothetical protein
VKARLAQLVRAIVGSVAGFFELAEELVLIYCCNRRWHHVVQSRIVFSTGVSSHVSFPELVES